MWVLRDRAIVVTVYGVLFVFLVAKFSLCSVVGIFGREEEYV